MKKSSQELKSRVLKEAQEKEAAQEALVAAAERYKQLAEAVGPLVDVFVTPVTNRSHEVLVERVRHARDGLRDYIRDMAQTIVGHLLSLVKALKPDQDMKPFVEGEVEDVPEERYAELEAEVAPVTEAVLKRLDF